MQCNQHEDFLNLKLAVRKLIGRLNRLMNNELKVFWNVVIVAKFEASY